MKKGDGAGRSQGEDAAGEATWPPSGGRSAGQIAREAHVSAAEAAGRQQIGESSEPQQIADPEPGLAELDALMNSMTRQEEMAFQAWREQRGPAMYGSMHIPTEVGLVAAWRAEQRLSSPAPSLPQQQADTASQHQAAQVVLESLDILVRGDFLSWLQDYRNVGDPLDEPHLEDLLCIWRNSDEYEDTKNTRIAETCHCPRDREKMRSLPYAELKRRVEDGMLGQPGESQAVYDARVRADRLARGVELGEYFTNPSAFSGTHLPYCTCTYDGEVATPAIPGLTCDADGSISAADLLGDLINYGSRAGEWQPSGGDHVPEDWVGDGTLDSNRDGDYLGMPYLTSFCTACKRIRSDEPFLSHVARDPDLRVCMCMKVSTTVSVRLCVAVGDSVRLRDALCQHCRKSDPVEDQ